MGFSIPSCTTDYGEVKENIYCCITQCDNNALRKELHFFIRPYVSREVKNNGYQALLISDLERNDVITDVEHDAPMLKIAYEWIKAKIALFADPDFLHKAHGYEEEDPDNPGSSIYHAPEEDYMEAEVYSAYAGALDVLEEEE